MPRKRRRTITAEELHKLSWANSPRMPRVVQDDGERYQWVGIGWVHEGKAKGHEVKVVHPCPKNSVRPKRKPK